MAGDIKPGSQVVLDLVFQPELGLTKVG